MIVKRKKEALIRNPNNCDLPWTFRSIISFSDLSSFVSLSYSEGCGQHRPDGWLVPELSCREIETETRSCAIATHGSWHVRPPAPTGAAAPVLEVHRDCIRAYVPRESNETTRLLARIFYLFSREIRREDIRYSLHINRQQ